MASSGVILDTSILMEHLRKRNKRKSILFNIIDSYLLHAPTLVEFELYAGAVDAAKRQDVQCLLASCVILPLTPEIARHAAHLYQQLGQSNPDTNVRDLLIASTAIVHGYPLMTLNAEPFSRIDTLDLLTPPILSD